MNTPRWAFYRRADLRLRRMVEEDPAHPRYIQTVWGLGYVFVPDGSKA
ncbi:MAG: winged helix-turn-helix domain-containing protein [Enterobacter hormaechei]